MFRLGDHGDFRVWKGPFSWTQNDFLGASVSGGSWTVDASCWVFSVHEAAVCWQSQEAQWILDAGSCYPTGKKKKKPMPQGSSTHLLIHTKRIVKSAVSFSILQPIGRHAQSRVVSPTPQTLIERCRIKQRLLSAFRFCKSWFFPFSILHGKFNEYF